MKRMLFPLLGVVAALWAAYAIVQSQPTRAQTMPPLAPAESSFSTTVAAVGLIESSSENIWVGSPLAGIVTKVFVTAGDRVGRGDPLFEIDTRQLRADLGLRERNVDVARARVQVAAAQVDDLQRQLEIAERVADMRAISVEELTRRRAVVATGTATLAEARAAVGAAEAAVDAVRVELDRSLVRAAIAAEVLQVRVRVGEFAAAASTASPLMLLGQSRPLHARVDVDEHEAWRVKAGAKAIGHVRGNSRLKAPLTFVRFEPFVIPKRSLTGDTTERVDTRVLQVIYRIEGEEVPLLVGQQLDVFIDAGEGE
jgi:multidrug efflux pump subunit AcrA (membrane-fusion protein)